MANYDYQGPFEELCKFCGNIHRDDWMCDAKADFIRFTRNFDEVAPKPKTIKKLADILNNI